MALWNQLPTSLTVTRPELDDDFCQSGLVHDNSQGLVCNATEMYPMIVFWEVREKEVDKELKEGSCLLVFFLIVSYGQDF